MTEGNTSHPNVLFYPSIDEAKRVARTYGCEVKETFKVDGKKYTLIGGSCFNCEVGGIGGFNGKYGEVFPSLSLFSCKSEEIAKHMSRYFAKEIFEACYAHHVEIYEWIV